MTISGINRDSLRPRCVRFAAGVAPRPRNTRFRAAGQPYPGRIILQDSKRGFRFYMSFLLFQACPGARFISLSSFVLEK